jgi:twitching motility protein PilT
VNAASEPKLTRLAPLMAVLQKSGASEMVLEPGQRIAVLQSGRRREVGREPLKLATLDRIAADAFGDPDTHIPSDRTQWMPCRHEDVDYEVGFQRKDDTTRIAIRRPAADAPAPADDTVVLSADDDAPIPLADPPRRAPRCGSAPDRAGRPSQPRLRPGAEETQPSTAAASADSMDALLRLMVRQDASDLHMSAGSCPVFRIDGEIRFAKALGRLAPDRIDDLAREIMHDAAREEFETTHDADFAYELDGVGRFRVNTFRDRRGPGVVVRQIPLEILSTETLGLSTAVTDLCHLSKGLVVVTGPTGSGKSTTLAAMVDYINRNRADHIVTIEDPIEFVHENRKCLVNQREVGRHTGSFKTALRAALREDPDVVLVGEMRDLETVAIAIETAETGHLVFGTLHTTTAISTVDRIIDQFPPDRQAQIRVMLANSLKGVVAQVLCKKTGGGRAAAMEVLLVNPAVSSLLRESKTHQIASVMQTSGRLGMRTMNESLLELVQGGTVAPQEAMKRAVDKAGLQDMLQRAGIRTG